MSDVGESQFVHRMLECNVCLCNFNTKENMPKALRCQHTFCQRCIEKLLTGNQIRCPKCRTKSEETNIITNFAVLDIVEALCEECHNKQKHTKCNHCGRHFCRECLEAHTSVIQTDAKNALQKLTEKVSHITRISTETNVIVRESNKAEDLKNILRKQCTTKHEKINEEEKTLSDEIDAKMDENIQKYTEWRENVDIKLIKLRTFIQTSEHKLTRGTIQPAEITVVQEKCSEFFADLEKDESLKPEMNQVECSIGQATGVVRKPTKPIVYKAPQSPPPQYHPAKVRTKYADGSVDYTSVKLKLIVGQKGSGPHDFHYPGAVTIIPSDGSIAVTDFYNHRVKLFDSAWKLMSIFGSHGSKVGQFDQLPGICANEKDEIFVSDGQNHRIQIFSRYSQFLTGFGQQGSEPGELYRPAGSAFGKNGMLYVCDEYNRRIQVFLNGKFARMFGSQGSGPDQFEAVPVYLALADNGHVIVSDGGKGIKVFTTSGKSRDPLPRSLPSWLDQVQPNGIAIGNQGHIIVVDIRGFLVVLNKQGHFICTICSEGEEAGLLKGPDGVAVTPDGDIVVCDGQNHRIQVFKVCKNWDEI